MPLPWLQAAWPETVCAMTRTYAVPSTCELTESLLRLALDFIRRGPTAWCNSHGRFAKALMAKLLDSLSVERGWPGKFLLRRVLASSNGNGSDTACL